MSYNYAIQGLRDKIGRNLPTIFVYVDNSKEDFFLVVIHTDSLIPVKDESKGHVYEIHKDGEIWDYLGFSESMNLDCAGPSLRFEQISQLLLIGILNIIVQDF